MKKLCLVALLAAVAPAAFGQTQSPQTVTIPAYSITMPERTLGRMASDFDTYRGGYDLSNGQTLTLTTSGVRMYARLDNGERHEIAGIGRGRFVARDLSMKITLERKADGDFGGELLIARSPAVAGQPMEYVRLAMR